VRAFVIGGTGFIGYRLARLLVARGSIVTCMDTNPAAHSFADLGGKVTSVRGDVTHFDEVMTAMTAAKPDRVVNLAYLIGDHAPHAALKLNILGMDNCFEAARLLGVTHTVYAHIDDMAEVFARVLTTDKPAHRVYNSGGTAISLGEIADIVRSYLPDAQINFQHERGAKARNSTYLLDNSRLLSEFSLQYRPFRERVLQIINDIRRDAGLPLVG